MLFCLICTDRPGAEAVRLANREAHLSYWGESGVVKIGGPFTSDEGDLMTGSMLVIEVEDRAAAEKLADNDPYRLAGLFQAVDIRPWRWLLGKPEGV